MKIANIVTVVSLAQGQSPPNSAVATASQLRAIRKQIGSALSERQATSLCSLRPNENQCCEDFDGSCYGCNPVLLEQGQTCENQQSFLFDEPSRDCFCDDACIELEDCCDDHTDVCSQYYTSAPDTTTTLLAPTSQSNESSPSPMMENLQSILKNNKKGGHPHLERKWEKITEKWSQRNLMMVQKQCNFTDQSIDMSINSENDACKVSQFFCIDNNSTLGCEQRN